VSAATAARLAAAAPPEAAEAVEVAPGVLWMRLALPMALDHVNVYALDDADGWTLVDTGLDTPRGRAQWQALLAGPLAGRAVRRVVVTHHHPDHVGLAGHFQAGGAELVATRTAWLLARMLRLDVQARPGPEKLAFWRDAGMAEDLLAARAAERPFNFADCVSPLPLGYTRIAEGGRIVMGGRRWQVRCGDGHAPEHATFWSLDDDLVLGGDQLLPAISANIGVYPTEPGADPLAEWLGSCARFRAVARDNHLVLPGHKRPYTGLPARLGVMIAEHAAALDRLREHLARPRRATDCFGPLFGREVPASEYGLALAEAVAHLNHLLARGEVSRSRAAPDGPWLWQAATAPGATGSPVGDP
jgi:glyoxylase-like metal-dependent hydrolase (beta-lactamase superfamily II)